MNRDSGVTVVEVPWTQTDGTPPRSPSNTSTALAVREEKSLMLPSKTTLGCVLPIIAVLIFMVMTMSCIALVALVN